MLLRDRKLIHPQPCSGELLLKPLLKCHLSCEAFPDAPRHKWPLPSDIPTAPLAPFCNRTVALHCIVTVSRSLRLGAIFYSSLIGADVYHLEPLLGLSLFQLPGVGLQTALKCHPALGTALSEEQGLSQGHTPFPAS